MLHCVMGFHRTCGVTGSQPAYVRAAGSSLTSLGLGCLSWVVTAGGGRVCVQGHVTLEGQVLALCTMVASAVARPHLHTGSFPSISLPPSSSPGPSPPLC